MNELSLNAVNERINSINNMISSIIVEAEEKVSETLQEKGLNSGNIYTKYLTKDAHVETLRVRNLYANDLTINGESLIGDNYIKTPTCDIKYLDGLYLDNKQVLLQNDTCLSSCYEGVYSVYLLTDMSEIVISGAYKDVPIDDIIIPIQELINESSVAIGNNAFAILINRNEEECTIVPRNKYSNIINVIMR